MKSDGDYVGMNCVRIFSLSEAEIAPANAYGDTREEMWANARLIAAAPDLLEACKQMLAALDQLHREGLREYHPIADDTRAAIAKATQ